MSVPSYVSDYWEECVGNALEDCGITATPEQVKAVGESVRVGHECYGQAFHSPENPLIGEVSTLKRLLQEEREKVFCRYCNGRGSITENFGPSGRSATGGCPKCHGEGKHKP